MAFEDDVARYADQIKGRLPHIRGEEATKQALVVPLFHVLGYDVYDPREVQPEYGADFKKKGAAGQAEKVDYALKINGEPAIFVECKAVDVELDNHDAQLARYFNATPTVRVAILTNGLRIKVFTDLQQPNMMDDKPWMDFDIRAAKPAEIDALKRFRKADFAADLIVGLAEEMVYYNVLVPFISAQLRDPGEKLVRLVAEEIPSIKRIDKKAVDRLTPILRKAIQAAILDHVARSFSAPAAAEEAAAPTVAAPTAAQGQAAAVGLEHAKENVAPTAEDLEAFAWIQKIVREKQPDLLVAHRKSRAWFAIVQRGVRSWFMRLTLDQQSQSWAAFRHVKPDAARAMLPGLDVVDGGQFGDSRVNLRAVSDLQRLKPLVLAAYEAEMAKASHDGDPEAGGVGAAQS
jgi:hypothetical protein